MSLTQDRVAIVADGGVSVTTGGGTVNHAFDLSGYYGGMLDIKIKNGATGPTVNATVQIQHSTQDSPTEYFNVGGPLVGALGNNVETSWGGIELPLGFKKGRLVVTAPTGQNVTLLAHLIRNTRLIG
jgi:hypothetical protein